jgi:hypothetical protein
MNRRVLEYLPLRSLQLHWFSRCIRRSHACLPRLPATKVASTRQDGWIQNRVRLVPIYSSGSSDNLQDMFSALCHVNADISAVPKIVKVNPAGKPYSEQIARVVLLFGLTELKAQLCWDQNVRLLQHRLRII